MIEVKLRFTDRCRRYYGILGYKDTLLISTVLLLRSNNTHAKKGFDELIKHFSFHRFDAAAKII